MAVAEAFALRPNGSQMWGQHKLRLIGRQHKSLLVIFSNAPNANFQICSYAKITYLSVWKFST